MVFNFNDNTQNRGGHLDDLTQTDNRTVNGGENTVTNQYTRCLQKKQLMIQLVCNYKYISMHNLNHNVDKTTNISLNTCNI